jgi:hypothetical protein
MSRDDLAWLDSLRWDDANVPRPTADQIERYKRVEAALNGDIADLSVFEKGATLQSKLAAAIGARLADFDEAGASNDD